MAAPEPLPSRLIGALFVERGLVSESQIRVALEIQRETGQQLGQVLVERFGVSRRELASVVAEQWAKLGGSAGPEDTASWRRLGEIFVERGFVTQDELDQALARQRQTGERLGEALVAQGVISKFELAGALAEQMAVLGDPEKDTADGTPEQAATVHQLPTRESTFEEPTPDNVVELGLPTETLGEGTPVGYAPRVGPDGAPVPLETSGDGATVSEPPAAETGEVGVLDSPSAEPTEAGTLEVEITEEDLIRAGILDAPEPDPDETLAEEAVPDAEPADSFEADAVEIPEATPFVLSLAEPAELSLAERAPMAFQPPEPEAVELQAAVELPVADPAEPAAVETPEADVSEVGAGDVLASEGVTVEPEALDVVEFAEVGAADVLASEGMAVEPEALDVVEFAEVGAADVFASEGVTVAPEAPDDVAELAEVGGSQPAEVLLTDLHDALPTDTAYRDDPAEAEPLVSCVAFAPTTEGYRMIALESLPAPGETIDVPEIGERVVLRVGRSPIPTDARLCAYVEEPVTAPVGVAVH